MPVRKGQLIFEIDDSEYYTALLSAQAALESSRALALEAKNNFDRAVPLAKINAISGTQLDQYTAQYAASEADVKSARQVSAECPAQSGLHEDLCTDRRHYRIFERLRR